MNDRPRKYGQYLSNKDDRFLTSVTVLIEGVIVTVLSSHSRLYLASSSSSARHHGIVSVHGRRFVSSVSLMSCLTRFDTIDGRGEGLIGCGRNGVWINWEPLPGPGRI